jgi:DNA repair ATPase RecN
MEKNESTSGGNKVNWILIVLLALSLIMNFYLWQTNTIKVEQMVYVTDSLSLAKQEVEREFEDVLEELGMYKADAIKNDSLLAEAEKTIKQHRERIEKLLSSEKNYSKLNKKLEAELAELYKIRDEYLEKINALTAENTKLKEETVNLNQRIGDLETNLNKTVTTASVIKAEYVRTSAFKMNMFKKPVVTTVADKVYNMKVCFSVMDNQIAQAGQKEVHLRIVEPGGKTMGDRSSGSGTFKLAGSGEEVQYTASQQIDYNNQKQDLCLNWSDSKKSFAPGTYIIEVYVDGNLSSASSHVLK